MKRTMAALLAATVLLGACGDGEGAEPAARDAGGSTSSTVRASAGRGAGGDGGGEQREVERDGEGARPEGDWEITRYRTEPGEQGDVVYAGRRSYHFEPTCDAGPCDVEVTPAGPGGTYWGPGYPVRAADEPGEPFLMTWDDAGGVYRIVDADTDACTMPDGTYSTDLSLADWRADTDLTFVPADGDEPARLVGTRVETWHTNAAGRTAGCDGEEETITWATSARPAGTRFEDVEVDGDFGQSLVVTDADDYARAHHPDFVGSEQSYPRPWTLTGDCAGASPAACAIGVAFSDRVGGLHSIGLLAGDGGWAGASDAWHGDCTVNGSSTVVAAGAYTNVLSVADLQVVDAVDGRATVLVGTLRETGTPAPAVAAADPVNCFDSYTEGQLILVATDAADGR